MPPTVEEEDEFHGDTIIVKGEYPWSRPSSPDSMSPDIQPLVENLLAQMHTPQQLESPEPLEGEGPEESSAPTSRASRPNVIPSQVAIPRTTRIKPKREPTTMEERLISMPEKRPLPWREGVDPGAEHETGGDSRRKQIRFGCLLATRGEIQEVPCNSCANGRGKFNVCVALDGFFKGACASCQLSGRPNRCSIKKSDDVADTSMVDTPSAGEMTSRNIYQQPPSSDPPQTKRRRTDTGPDWEGARPQWEEQGDSHARQQQQMKDIVQRPWATVNSPAPPPATTTTPQGNMNGVNGTQSAPPNTAWATVNQPAPPPAPPAFSSGGDSKSGGYRSSYDQGRREVSATEEGSAALIDNLPKNKQRQVYGLISGLQGGIEHLQRELDSLKRALGIDDED